MNPRSGMPMRVAAAVAGAVLLLGACGPRRFEPIEDAGASPGVAPTDAASTVSTVPPAAASTASAERASMTTAPAPAPAPASVSPAAAPAVHVAAAARQTVTVSDVEAADLGRIMERVSSRPVDDDTVAEWIAALNRLERALDAEAIRALGDDPVVERIAGPVDELDQSVIEVIARLDPRSGRPDYLGALLEARTAVERWEAAVPGMEEAWEDAVARWTAEWERAVADWEQAWADAAAAWEQEWADAVAEWEQAWADAVAEWEQAWADAVAEWERAWQEAVDEWEREAAEG